MILISELCYIHQSQRSKFVQNSDYCFQGEYLNYGSVFIVVFMLYPIEDELNF